MWEAQVLADSKSPKDAMTVPPLCFFNKLVCLGSWVVQIFHQTFNKTLVASSVQEINCNENSSLAFLFLFLGVLGIFWWSLCRSEVFSKQWIVIPSLFWVTVVLPFFLNTTWLLNPWATCLLCYLVYRCFSFFKWLHWLWPMFLQWLWLIFHLLPALQLLFSPPINNSNFLCWLLYVSHYECSLHSALYLCKQCQRDTPEPQNTPVSQMFQYFSSPKNVVFYYPSISSTVQHKDSDFSDKKEALMLQHDKETGKKTS